MPFDDQNSPGPVDHSSSETHCSSVPEPGGAALEEVIEEIRLRCRKLHYLMRSRIRSENGLGDYLRRQLGWVRDGDSAMNAAAKEGAARLVATGWAALSLRAKQEDRAVRLRAIEAGGKKPPKLKSLKPVEGIDDPRYQAEETMIIASLLAISPFADEEAHQEAKLIDLGSRLPVAAWWRENVFDSTKMLAEIIGEAGDLSRYANPGKLWKRMARAPYTKDGVTRSCSQWRRRGGLTSDEWADPVAGPKYSLRRSSLMRVIGVVLEKDSGGYLRAVYLDAKSRRQDRAKQEGLIVAPSSKIPAKRRDEFISEGHIRNWALMYTEKRLLRDLWAAWQAASLDVKPKKRVPPASSSADEAERSAKRDRARRTLFR